MLRFGCLLPKLDASVHIESFVTYTMSMCVLKNFNELCGQNIICLKRQSVFMVMFTVWLQSFSKLRFSVGCKLVLAISSS